MYEPWYNRRQVFEEIKQVRQNSIAYHVNLFILKFAPFEENVTIRKNSINVKY